MSHVAEMPVPSHPGDAEPPAGNAYQHLEQIAVRRSTDALRMRILTRFPDRTLGPVCGELIDVIDDIGADPDRGNAAIIAAKIVTRVVAAAVIVTFAVAFSMAVTDALARRSEVHPVDWIPLIESFANDLVFGGLAILFLLAVPQRMERARVLRILHRLRSLSHVIDMHQLSKVPDRLRRGGPDAGKSDMTREEMTIYLEYSSEMLSLVGKAAALFAEDNTDNEVLDAVSDIEELSSDMSRKVWQKIAIIQSGTPTV